MSKTLLFSVFFYLASCSVIDLTPSNFDQVIDGSKAAFVEFFAPWCGHSKNLAPEYEIVGDAFSSQPSVVIAKVDADSHKDLGSRFDVHGFPTLKFFPKGSTKPEDYQGGRTADDIITFINNKVGTRVKAKKAASAVTILDDSNFDKIVMDPTKDVLVEFYAPWCGHCKRLAPDYEKVASAFENEKNVVVANIDADEHKSIAEKYGVSGFPTLKWFSKNNKQPQDYDQGRDVQTFIDFINHQSGTFRESDGTLNDQAGTIKNLDNLAEQYVSSSDRSGLLKEAEKVVSGLSESDQKNGKIYVKVMENIQSKGNDYVQSEISRVGRMLEGSISLNKADEFTVRLNILRAFQN